MIIKLFNPKSIAVIGASRDKNKLGYSVLANILKYKFKGRVYPVNPQAEKILHLKCYPSVLAIKSKIDLAVIIVPAKIVPPILIECGQKKIYNAIVISAGFKEVGSQGLVLEQKIKEIAAEFKINLLGPNCLGILDSVSNLNASFADGMIIPGKVAFMSQSGAIGTAMLDWAQLHQLGFSRFVSLGNKAGITENELLEFFKKDKNTEVILAYLEGIADGPKFLEVCQEVTQTKPVIILKAGKSVAGQKAISSHTGSLAGSDQVVEAAFQQSGVIRANSLIELFNYVKLFSSQPLLKGNKVAVVANAGGPSVMTTDAIADSNLELAKLSLSTIKLLKKKLPLTATVNNPVDLVGDARADRYQLALEAVFQDKNVDAVIVLLTPQTVTEIEKTAQLIVDFSKKYNKPVVTSFIGGGRVKAGIKILNKNNIPTYDYPEEAVKALGAMAEYHKNTKIQKHKNTRLRVIDRKVWQKIEKILNQSKGQIEWRLTEEILKNYKIPVVKSRTAKDASQAVRIAKRFGYPVVMKVVAKKLIHKTDANGVLVNLENSEAVEQGFKKINKVARKYKGNILVQPMIKNGQEVILGVKRDPQFGPVVMFGLGGVYVEVLKDVTFRIAPIDQTEALAMISEIKAFDLLKGVRGEPGVDLKSLAEVLVKLSQLAADFPQIKEMDINPAMAMKKGCEVVDVRIII